MNGNGRPAFTRTSMAPCGVNCGVCLAHLRTKDRCSGCLSEEPERTPHCRSCSRFLHCGERTAGRVYCYECSKFPCTNLKRLEKRYTAKYGVSPIGNLVRMRDEGLEAFLRSEEARWRCPACGSTLCMHRPACPRCDAPRPDMPSI